MPVLLFFLGTGRSGTQAAADTLSALPGWVIRHEVPPMLLPEAVDYLRGRMSEESMVETLRRTREPLLSLDAEVVGEANQRLAYVLPALAKAFPRARYAWMLRDGRDSVASMYHRFWYHPREERIRAALHAPSARNRITAPLVRDMDEDAWARLGDFERCCWYWAYTNRSIPVNLNALGLAFVRFRLEDLPGALLDVAGFAGMELRETPPARVSNSARHGPPLRWRDWCRAWRDLFERYCGTVMDEHYPGWRDGEACVGKGRSSRWRRATYSARRSSRVLWSYVAGSRDR